MACTPIYSAAGGNSSLGNSRDEREAQLIGYGSEENAVAAGDTRRQAFQGRVVRRDQPAGSQGGFVSCIMTC